MKRALRNLGDNFAGRIIDLMPDNLLSKAYWQTLRLDKPLSAKLVFKLAQSRDELEGCFRLLHDEYVCSGYMLEHPSGLRVTLHHALPTTSTLICLYGSKTVGTVSLIRENRLGFPMQRIFNIDEIFKIGGNVAEVSALAVSRDFEVIRNQILIPMLKFLYEYAEYRFDTRHLVIAVNPRQIAFYENVLCFNRLAGRTVNHYDFAGGAPAVAAHLDLVEAKAVYYEKYNDLPPDKNLYHYFTAASLPNGQFPHRRFHTTTDPVMTPELLTYFFRDKTDLFSSLTVEEISLLHSLYDLSEYQNCLPPKPQCGESDPMRARTHRRFPVRCPARLVIWRIGVRHSVALTVYECSEKVFCAHAESALPVGVKGEVEINLGEHEQCILPVEIVRLSKHNNRVAMLKVLDTGGIQGRQWTKFVRALACAPTGADLEEATRFSNDVT